MEYGLPVTLRISGCRCVIVGGGSVALRRAKSLLEASAKVVVIAPHVSKALADLPIEIEHRCYRQGDLQKTRLVVIATDDLQTNQQIATEALKEGVLVNRTDVPALGDFSVPAHAHHGPITLAVDTGGISANASAQIRRQLSSALDPMWGVLLMRVKPYRQKIQQLHLPDQQRKNYLMKLSDQQAQDVFKNQGQEAFLNYLERLFTEAGKIVTI